MLSALPALARLGEFTLWSRLHRGGPEVQEVSCPRERGQVSEWTSWDPRLALPDPAVDRAQLPEALDLETSDCFV